MDEDEMAGRMSYRTRIRVVQHFDIATFEDIVNLAIVEMENLGRTIIEVRTVANGNYNLVAIITYGWYEPISAP